MPATPPRSRLLPSLDPRRDRHLDPNLSPPSPAETLSASTLIAATHRVLFSWAPEILGRQAAEILIELGLRDPVHTFGSTQAIAALVRPHLFTEDSLSLSPAALGYLAYMNRLGVGLDAREASWLVVNFAASVFLHRHTSSHPVPPDPLSSPPPETPED